MTNIKQRLEQNHQITPKQFESVIKYIEREPKFQRMDRPSIRTYFDELIDPSPSQFRPQKEPTNDLTKFFN